MAISLLFFALVLALSATGGLCHLAERLLGLDQDGDGPDDLDRFPEGDERP